MSRSYSRYYNIYAVVGSKDYFILTSNGDEHLELSGFDPSRVYEVEGTFRNMFESVDTSKEQTLSDFLRKYTGRKLVILELGIGSRNRLIKLPLMQLAYREPNAKYITLNMPDELFIPQEIATKSIGLAGDIAETLKKLQVCGHDKSSLYISRC